MLKIVSSREDWDKALSGFSDISVLASSRYMLAAAPLEKGGTALLAVYDHDDIRLCHPFVRRSIPDSDNRYDLISVFDFGGFWIMGGTATSRKEAVAEFEAAFGDWCVNNDIVCEFVRIHPFASFDTQLLTTYEVELFCENVTVDLSAGYEAIFDGYSNSRQKQVRQGRDKYGLIAEEKFNAKLFIEVFHDNLRRINSSGFYFFPQAFIEQVKSFSKMFFARTPEGDICAAHLYIQDGPVVFAYLCHGVADYHQLRPNDFLYDYALHRFSQSGYKNLHFGGGADSLLAYKQSFSPGRVKYRIARRIFNDPVYNELSDKNPAASQSSFFPRYRIKNTTKQE